MKAASAIARAVLRTVPMQRVRLRKYSQESDGVPQRSAYASAHGIKVGVLKCFTPLHKHLVAACEALKVAYEVLDLVGEGWLEHIESADCDIHLFWPATLYSYWKKMGDDRIGILTRDMKRRVYPSREQIWLHESKSRMHYWMRAHGIAHPRTWVFYDEEEALRFAGNCELPVVFKTEMGSSASGVRIAWSRSQVKRLIRKAFSRGFVNWMQGPVDRQVGYVIFQAYAEVRAEWRIIGFGKSYFGRQKKKCGEFHSGSKRSVWTAPPGELLDFAWAVNDRYAFSGDLDIFETADGEYLINEIQPVFGCSQLHQMRVNGVPGRYVRDDAGAWHFEEGVFTHHACSILRVIEALRLLGVDVDYPRDLARLPAVVPSAGNSEH